MSKTPRSDFGNRLVQSRKRAKLTQVKLARLVGMAQCTLSEAERVGLGSGHTAQLAQVLSVNAVWLATGQGLWDDAVDGANEGAGQRMFTAPLDVKGVMEQTPPGKQTPVLSPLAQELGDIFDLLTDRVQRAKAFSAATRLIISIYSGQEDVDAERPTDTTAAAPTGTPVAPARAYSETIHR